jgi:hypothetical protein
MSMLTTEQAAAAARYAAWLALWQGQIAADLSTLGLPDELIMAVHRALAELTRTTAIFASTAAGLPPPAVVVETA